MKRKRFLFVSWTSRGFKPYFDPSVRYRCFHMAMELTRRGHQAEVVSQEDLSRNWESFGDYDGYVFHRPLMNEFFADFIYPVRDRAIADFDDMIFDVSYADLTPMVRLRGAPSRQIRHYVAQTHEAARQFSRFTVSTQPLEDHCRRLFTGNVKVFHNAMEKRYLDLAEVHRRAVPRSCRIYDLGYFSGTATHDLDFKLIAANLAKFLSEHTRSKLLIVGPLELPPELNLFRSRIDLAPLVPFYQLPALKAQCKRILAPLEDTIFTRSKSGLKFFEAAVLGCDVVATPIPDIDRFDSCLLSKCRSSEDWDRGLCSEDVVDQEREDAIVEIRDSTNVASQVDAWIDFVA